MTLTEELDVVKARTKYHSSLDSLGRLHHVCRQTVKEVLAKHGVAVEPSCWRKGYQGICTVPGPSVDKEQG